MTLTPLGLVVEDGGVTRRLLSHHVVIVAFDGVHSLDVTGPAEVFAGASQLLASKNEDSPYEVSIVSMGGGVVSSESAVRLDTDSVASLGRRRIDTLVVPGGFEVLNLRNDVAFVGQLARLIKRCGRLVTVCSGAYLAAATGALDGHTVTTHWARSDRLAELHPELTVDADPIFIHSPSAGLDVWSSAGVTAGIDLSLALVESDQNSDHRGTSWRSPGRLAGVEGCNERTTFRAAFHGRGRTVAGQVCQPGARRRCSP